MKNQCDLGQYVCAALALLCLARGTDSLAQETVESNPCVSAFKDALVERIGIATKSSFARDFKTYLITDTFRKDLHDGKWGGSITVPIEGVPVTLGLNHSDSQYNEFRDQITTWKADSVKADFYQTLSASFPNSEMAKRFNECLDKWIPKEGFAVHVDAATEKFANFTIVYRKLYTKDHTPVVQGIHVVGGKIVQNYFKVGSPVEDETTVSCERDPNADLILTLQTDKQALNYKLPAKSPDYITVDSPIGTIIISFLNFSQFQAAHEGGRVWRSDLSKWAPCDGRQAPNSKFEKYANQKEVPDLRGMFLRGLNVMDPNPPASVKPLDSAKRDPEDRSVGGYQPDGLQKHTHLQNIHNTGSGRGGGSGDGAFQAGTMKTGPNDDGGVETRPKNVSIYYFIRIN